MESNLPAIQQKHLASINQELTDFKNPVKSIPDDEVKKPIRYVLALIGLPSHKAPTEIEKALHVQFLRENYPDYTPGEIKFAFSKAIARKFGPDINVTCYENFSCEYIGRILSAYEEWKGDVVENFRFGTYEDRENQLIENINAAYLKFLETGAVDLYPSSFYFLLLRYRMVSDLPLSMKKRVYPKQLAVVESFSKMASKGYSALFEWIGENKLKAV